MSAAKASCSVPECQNKAISRTFCSKHWQRWSRHGNPTAGRVERGSVINWIMNVAVHFEGDECLPWPFAKCDTGYGSLRFEGKAYPAHRFICKMAHGDKPEHKDVAAHSCGGGHLGCVNPKHLRWATYQENQADRVLHGTTIRGSLHKSAKLDEHDVRRIRSLKGVSKVQALADEYSVCASHISAIQAGKEWGWLEDEAIAKCTSRINQGLAMAGRLKEKTEQ